MLSLMLEKNRLPRQVKNALLRSLLRNEGDDVSTGARKKVAKEERERESE